MVFQRVHYLPVFMMLLFPITFLTTYCIAVAREDVTPLFPYISDTGTFSPESCIFGQMLNLGAMIMFLIAYIRYLQLCHVHDNLPVHANVRKFNYPSFIMGLLASLGISIVGNFQETNSLIVHLTGAVLAFGVGGVYLSLQTYIAFKIHPHLGNKTVNWIRAFLSAGVFIFFIFTFLFAALAYLNITGEQQTMNTKWKPGEEGWGWHFMSTFSEWILAVCQIVFLGSFALDFKRLSVTTLSVTNSYKI